MSAMTSLATGSTSRQDRSRRPSPAESAGEQWLLKDYRRALEFYRQARELTPNYYPITKDIAECYVALGDKVKAEEALQQYIAAAQAGHGLDQAKLQLASLR